MKIGILGVGHIGKTLTQRLSAAGHEVKVANSRGPRTIEADVLSSGGDAVTATEAVADVDVVILSIPLNRIPQVAPLIAGVPAGTVVIDTSNYYPARDDRIEAVDAGQVESLWVTEQLGRPVAKAWNAIGSHSFAIKGKPHGSLTASPSPSPPTATRTVRWPWRWSRTPDSTPLTPGPSRTHGVSSRARRATARTFPARRCRARCPRRRPIACPGAATSPSPRSRKGSGTPPRTPTRGTAFA